MSSSSSFYKVVNPTPDTQPALYQELATATNALNADLAAYTVVNDTWAANVTINWDLANLHRITLTGSTCNLLFTGGKDGEKLTLEVTQDATGNRTAVFPSNVRYSTLLPAITLTTTPNRMDKLGFMYNAATNTYDLVAFVYGYI